MMIDIWTNRNSYYKYIEAVAAVLDLWDKDVIINVEFNKKLDSDAGGYCSGEGKEIDIEIATHIQGEKCPKADIQRYIAHEMVHAKQMLEGRLVDHGLQIGTAGDTQVLYKAQTWEGEVYTNTPYEKQPWEIEAYKMEEQVMKDALSCFK